MFTPEEIKILEKSPIYQYYSATPWSTLTPAIVRAHIQGISKTSLENLPIIKFLGQIYDMVTRGQFYNGITTTQQNLYAKVEDVMEQTRDVAQWQQNGVYGVNSTGIYASLAGAMLEFTLAGGAIAATAIWAPGASNKFHVLKVIVSSDLPGAAGGQNYKLIFTEETTAENYGTHYFNSLNQPVTIPLNAVGTTDDKDLLLEIAGGNGVEHIWIWVIGGNW